MDEKLWQNAMVIYANWTHRIQPASAFTYTQVQSRFLCWCESGKGTLKINNVAIKMTPGKVIFAPWNHSISWITDTMQPFITGSIHIIPDMPHENPIRYGPFHAATPELAEFCNRRNEITEGFEDTAVFEIPLDHPLLHLGRYVIDRFSAECPEFMLRTFPRQLLYELYMLKAGVNQTVPNPLQRMLDTIEHYLEDNISMKMLKSVSQLSQPTIYRIFKKHLNSTPGEYITRRRLERSAELLRTTGLPIQEISRRLQFSNQFYFSKCFKEHFSVSPRKFRNSDSTLPVLRPNRESFSQWDIHGKKHYFYQPDTKET